jgi:hypothetical protein
MTPERTRLGKLLISTIALIFTYLVWIAAYFPYRVTNDETYVFPDLHTLVEQAHLEQANYFSGIGYQLVTTVLLRVTGVSLRDLQLLNPVVATLVFATLISVCYVVYRHAATNPYWWGFAPVPLAFFVFGGYVNRIRESTHKGYTQALLFVGLYLTYRILRDERHDDGADLKFYVLLIAVSGTITLFNYVWGFVYAALFAALLFQHRSLRRRAVVMAAVMNPTALLVPFLHPAIRIHSRFKQLPSVVMGFLTQIDPFRAGESSDASQGGASTGAANETSQGNVSTGRAQSQSAAQEGASTAGVLAKPTDRISQWPSLTVPGTEYTISAWFVYTAGIFGVALLTLLSILDVCRRFYRRNQLRASEQLMGGIWVYFGVLSVVLLALGNVNTFRRVIVVPGVFGVVYWASALSNRGRSWPVLQRIAPRRRTLLTILLVFLLVSSVLAASRTLLNGGTAPYDIYADENEVEKIEWIDSHTQSTALSTSCLRTHQEKDGHLSAKILGHRRNPVRARPPTNTVYSSGPQGRISCVQNP